MSYEGGGCNPLKKQHPIQEALTIFLVKFILHNPDISTDLHGNGHLYG